LEAPDAVVHGVPRAEDQHGRVDAAAAQGLDERQAVQRRQHEVDDGDVGPGLERERETTLAIAGHVDRKAGLPQALGDEVGDGGVVFDDQGSHKLQIADCRLGIGNWESGIVDDRLYGRASSVPWQAPSAWSLPRIATFPASLRWRR